MGGQSSLPGGVRAGEIKPKCSRCPRPAFCSFEASSPGSELLLVVLLLPHVRSAPARGNQPKSKGKQSAQDGGKEPGRQSSSGFNPSSTETELWGVRPIQAMESSPPTITVQVKFAGRTIPVEVPAAATTAELKRLLQPLTNVLPRGQRLVCKGKVLQDAASLSSMHVVDGSKVMLIASQGLHQGDGPITKNSSSSATSVTRASNVKEHQTQKPEAVVGKSRAERWKLTGVVALHDCDLKAVPEEVWDCGPSVRILDASNNCIKEIPHKIAALKSLNKLLLTANDIDDENISWEGLSCLQKLLNLSLSQNRLASLPSTLGSLTSLRELRIANNRLDNLPIEIGWLKHLQILIANNNRIATLPSSIGDCESLTEVDLSSNLLTELPEAFGKLYNLKVLHLRNNGLTSLPSTLFKKCMQLITLDLHGTEITNDILRQVEGWEEFDERRRQKHQKQLDFRVGSSGVFDEGADDDNRRR